MTTLIDVTRALLALRRKECSESEWQSARDTFQEPLTTSSADEIRTSLALDERDLLPIDLKSAMYERLLEVEGRTPEILRQYAWHLQLHGPDWDDKAEALLAEADDQPAFP